MKTTTNTLALRAFMRGAKRIICCFPPDGETARALACVSAAEDETAFSMNELNRLYLIQTVAGIVNNLCNEYRFTNE